MPPLKCIIKFTPAFLYLLFFTSVGWGLEEREQFCKIISEKTSWKLEGERSLYTPLTLAKYSPKAAPIFLEYGFDHLTCQEFTSGQEKVRMELYEMVDSPAAYGVFTCFRDPESKPTTRTGTEGEKNKYGLSFYKGKFYLRLTCVVDRGGCVSRLPEFAKTISDLLPGSPLLPTVAKKLPTEQRIPQSEVFLMGGLALDRFLPLKGQDPFGLGVGAEAAYARYATDLESASLLVIYYPNQQLARKFLEAGYHEFSVQRPGQPIYFKRDGPLVTLVYDTTSPELATTLLDKIGFVSLVTFDPKVNPLSIAQVLLNIFIFCGVMLGLTLAAGILFGIVRIFVKKYFPGKVFDREEDVRVIRMDLSTKKPPPTQP